MGRSLQKPVQRSNYFLGVVQGLIHFRDILIEHTWIAKQPVCRSEVIELGCARWEHPKECLRLLYKPDRVLICIEQRLCGCSISGGKTERIVDNFSVERRTEYIFNVGLFQSKHCCEIQQSLALQHLVLTQRLELLFVRLGIITYYSDVQLLAGEQCHERLNFIYPASRTRCPTSVQTFLATTNQR